MDEQISMQIITRLRQINRELAKHSKHLHDNFQVTVPQLICLREVYEHGPISIGALTKIVFLNNSTVTRIVDVLEKKEYLIRNRISNDRRKVHLEITEQGTKFIQKAPVPLQKRFFDRFKDMDDKTISMILWALEMLVNMLGPEIPSPPVHLVQPDNETTTQIEI